VALPSPPKPCVRPGLVFKISKLFTYLDAKVSTAAKEMPAKVTFIPDGKAKLDHTVVILSGGCCMKLTLEYAMLQKFNILLMDELTSHLDVINVVKVRK
jgi:ATPase subunit of ABC transporter with duplicated ATPase domains